MPQTEEEKQRLKKEKLEAWKKQREMKMKDGKAKSATPEPADRKPAISSIAPVGKGESVAPEVFALTRESSAAALPQKPSAFSLSGLSRIGLPVKSATPVKTGSTLKRTITALDDEEESDRKLQKLDLPDVNPEVQSGDAAQVGEIGDDLAVADDDDVRPDIVEEANGHTNGDSKVMEVDVKPDPEEEEADPLEAYMSGIGAEVKIVNQTDARRNGLTANDNESDDGEEVQNKAEEELTKAEALLQYVQGFFTRASNLADRSM